MGKNWATRRQATKTDKKGIKIFVNKLFFCAVHMKDTNSYEDAAKQFFTLISQCTMVAK